MERPQNIQIKKKVEATEYTDKKEGRGHRILWIPIYNYLYQKFIYVSISKLRR